MSINVHKFRHASYNIIAYFVSYKLSDIKIRSIKPIEVSLTLFLAICYVTT